MVSLRHAKILLCTALAGGACGGVGPERSAVTPALAAAHLAAPPPSASAHAQATDAPTAAPPASAATGTAPGRRASLRFELNGRRFPSPLVDAIVGGQPATLIVDTGATHHVVAGWLAAEISLPLTRKGDAATDHAGQAVAVSRLENASFSLAGWGAVREPELLVVAVPEILQKLGIGGFLSPQALAAEGRAVVLDLRGGSMTEAPIDEALRLLEEAPGAATLRGIRVCGGTSSLGIQLVAPVTIEGIAAEVKLDSGATHSSLFRTHGAGQRLAGRTSAASQAYAASGKYTVPTLQGAHLKLGTFETTADVDILPQAPKAPCASDGYMGMDVLRDCVLVLAGARSALRCAAR